MRDPSNKKTNIKNNRNKETNRYLDSPSHKNDGVKEENSAFKIKVTSIDDRIATIDKSIESIDNKITICLLPLNESGEEMGDCSPPLPPQSTIIKWMSEIEKELDRINYKLVAILERIQI